MLTPNMSFQPTPPAPLAPFGARVGAAELRHWATGRVISKKRFQSKLKEYFCEYSGGWLYNYLDDFYHCESYTISSRAKLQTLITKTGRIILEMGSSYPLLAFTNGIAGWRRVDQRYRHSPVELHDTEDLLSLLNHHIYYRVRKEDNYHITDCDFGWVTVFCHHGDWHFFAPQAQITKAKEA